MLADLWLFVRELFSQWLIYTGILARVLNGLEAHFAHYFKRWPHIEGFIKKHLHFKNISYVCLLIACYQAWLIEHRGQHPETPTFKLEIPGTKPQLVFEDLRLINLDMPSSYKGSPLIVGHQITARFALKNVGPVASTELQIGSKIKLSPILSEQGENEFYQDAFSIMKGMPAENVSIPSQRAQFFDASTDARMDAKALDELKHNVKMLYIAVAATYHDKETGATIPLNICGFYNVNEMELTPEHRGRLETLRQCKSGHND